ACATGAGPRVSLSPRTSISKVSSPRVTRNASPTRTVREGLARWPPTSTLLVSTACLARLRVLKNLAAHSHTSRRTCSTGGDSLMARPGRCPRGRPRGNLAVQCVARTGTEWSAGHGPGQLRVGFGVIGTVTPALAWQL